MKKKEIKDLRKKTTEELFKLLENRRFEIINSRTNAKSSKEKNLKKVKLIKHEIAQILTIIREGELVKEEGKENNNENI